VDWPNDPLQQTRPADSIPGVVSCPVAGRAVDQGRSLALPRGRQMDELTLESLARRVKALESALETRDGLADRRRRELKRLLSDLVKEGNAGENWTTAETTSWISRVEATIRPHFDEIDLEFFFKEFAQPGPDADTRKTCVAWLRSVLVKYSTQ
jgi:hypothetical protein